MMMKFFTLAIVTGLLAACFIPAAHAETDEEAIARFERNLAQAVFTSDTKLIEPVFADDFYSFNSTTGTRGTKADTLANLRSTDATALEMKFPPFFVHIFGNTAFAQGTNEETDLYQGKTIHGSYVWFDVFEKRNGRWMWIISESTKVDSKITDKIVCDKPFCAATQPGFSLKKGQ